MNTLRAGSLIAVACLAGCTSESLETAAPPPSHEATVAGAGYTTFDTIAGGCLNTALPAGSACNAFANRDAVFVTGGPTDATMGLTDGTYFFAVIAPGSQTGSFLDGGIGNLSSDDVANRTFTIEAHEVVSYAGTHPVGATADGRLAIGLAPFGDADGAAGVYILAICVAGATDPAQCRYDAFRIRSRSAPDVQVPASPLVHGGAFYDANQDGRWDEGEPGIPGWTIDYHDVISGTVETGADGRFTLELIPDGYLFVDRDPDRWYWIEVADDEVVDGVYFGVSTPQSYQEM